MMGDRVVFVFKNAKRIAPAVYSHWAGYEAPELLQQAGDLGLIRASDPGYAAARMCGYLHEQSPRDIFGLGLIDAPSDLEEATLKEYSHGDGGVIIVDVGEEYEGSEGAVSYHAGYHAKAIAGEPGYEPDDGERPREYPMTVKLNH